MLCCADVPSRLTENAPLRGSFVPWNIWRKRALSHEQLLASRKPLIAQVRLRGRLLTILGARPRRVVNTFPLSQLASGCALLTWRYLLTSRLLPYSMTHEMTSHLDGSQERNKLLILQEFAAFVSKMSCFQFSLCAGEQHVYFALVFRIFFFKHTWPLKEMICMWSWYTEDRSRGSCVTLGRGPGLTWTPSWRHWGCLHRAPGDRWSEAFIVSSAKSVSSHHCHWFGLHNFILWF